MKKWSLLLVLVLSMSLAFFMAACSDDDDDNGSGPDVTFMDSLAGDWLSAGTNVAPLLVALFQYDSVEVGFAENNTVTLNAHVTDGAWTGEVNGTFEVTESEDMYIHSIHLIYPTYEQEGIIEIIDGGNTMRLEVVQTVPDIGATPLTPDDGFGSDPNLGIMNIQTYIMQ